MSQCGWNGVGAYWGEWNEAARRGAWERRVWEGEMQDGVGRGSAKRWREEIWERWDTCGMRHGSARRGAR